MIELIISHPIKFTGSIFIVLLMFGFITADSRRLSKIMIPVVGISGVVYILTMIWNMP